MVISLDFIFCSGLHNLERSRGRKIFDSKEGQAGATVMIFASNLWAFILANSGVTLAAGPRGKARKPGKRAWSSAQSPHGAKHLCRAGHETGIAATITYFAMGISTKKRSHQIITWRNPGQSKDKTDNQRKSKELEVK